MFYLLTYSANGRDKFAFITMHGDRTIFIQNFSLIQFEMTEPQAFSWNNATAKNPNTIKNNKSGCLQILSSKFPGDFQEIPGGILRKIQDVFASLRPRM